MSFLFDPDRIFQENVARCSKAQFVVGPYRPDERRDVHATEVFLEPLVRLAIFEADPTPKLKILKEPNEKLLHPDDVAHDSSPGHPNESSWLALHPGSGSERKNWPEPKWRALLDRLIAETPFRLLLIGGEAEGDRLNRLAEIIPPGRFKLARSLPLPQLALLLQQCQAYLGHDSGISHLAAATGLPGVVLWGHTRAEIWRPRSDSVRLVTSDSGLDALSVEDVFSALRGQFGELMGGAGLG